MAKTTTLDQGQRAKVDGAWTAYDTLVRRGDVERNAIRDQIEEYLFQVGILEGLKRADRLVDAQRRDLERR